MDEGPFRMPRQAAENANDQPAYTAAPAHQPKPVNREPKPVHRSLSHTTLQDKKPKKPLIIGIISAILVVIVGAGIWTAVSSLGGSGAGIDGGKYQAVFFTNGQVYFGKLQQFNSEYMKLTDVYYLQSPTAEGEDTDSKNPQSTTNDQSNATLIKLGDEIHGPEDAMMISKDQVLFFENLKKDGKVSQSIEKYKNPN